MSRKIALLSLSLLSACSAAPSLLSAYEPQAVYVAACDAYRATGDEGLILVDVGENETAPLACDDYLR